MTTRKGLWALVIILVVVLIAAWSKLRFLDKESYDKPQRWRTDEHPAFQKKDRE